MTAPTIAAAGSAFVVGAIASLIGGALGGVAVGGKSLGNELAAMMGGCFGPLAGVAGLIVGLAVLFLTG